MVGNVVTADMSHAVHVTLPVPTGTGGTRQLAHQSM
jgi:hypothetical protein